jgi:maltose O-acetyltransferase
MARDLSQGDPRSQRERMLAGDLYIADDPVLARELLRAAELTKEYNESSPSEAAARRRILLELLGSLGEGTRSGRRSTANTATRRTSERGRS